MRDMALITMRYHVSGRVQGVFFRKNTADIARHLNLTGSVRNNPDGSVTADISGEMEAVEAFRDYIIHGRGAAQVKHVTGRSLPYHSYDGFTII